MADLSSAISDDGDPLCLLCVHAHPDDESSKGAGSVAKYAAEGVRTVLVCCTGGEEGEILNPALDTPEVRSDIAGVRRRELQQAADIIGYGEVVLLGYRDSGMPDSPANTDPRCFARAPLDEAVARLAVIIRRTRPQVVVTYGPDQEGYPHPDHLRVHEVTMPAIKAAADPAFSPTDTDTDTDTGAGDPGPWSVKKVYYSAWSRARVEATHRKFLELGLESPFDEHWFSRPSQDHLITTQVDIKDFADVRAAALKAHATQVDPTSKFWFGLPPDVARNIHPHDDYVLGWSSIPTTTPEDDLFAGVRPPVGASSR